MLRSHSVGLRLAQTFKGMVSSSGRKEASIRQLELSHVCDSDDEDPKEEPRSQKQNRIEEQRTAVSVTRRGWRVDGVGKKWEEEETNREREGCVKRSGW